MHRRLALLLFFLAALPRAAVAQQSPAACTYRTAAATLRVEMGTPSLHGFNDHYLAAARIYNAAQQGDEALISGDVGGGWNRDFAACAVLSQLAGQVLIFKTFYSPDSGRHFVNVYDLRREIEAQTGRRDLKICYPDFLNDSLLLLEFNTYDDYDARVRFVGLRGKDFKLISDEDWAVLQLYRQTMVVPRIVRGSLDGTTTVAGVVQKKQGRAEAIHRGVASAADRAQETRLMGGWESPPQSLQIEEAAAGSNSAARATASAQAEFQRVPTRAVGRVGRSSWTYRADHTMTRYFTLGDSVYHIAGRWHLHADTLVHAFALGGTGGDSVVMYYRLDTLTADRLVITFLSRQEAYFPPLCDFDGGITCWHARAGFSGDLGAYFRRALQKSAVAKRDYSVYLDFYVTCGGEVARIRTRDSGPVADAAAWALKRMPGWQPALCNGQAIDAEMHLVVRWEEGKVTARLYNPR